MMQRCRGTGSVGRVQWDTWAAAGPLVREVVIAPKGPLSALKAHFLPMACVIQHHRTLALKHQLLNKRKQDTVAASYNAVGGLNYFVGRRSSKINLLAVFNWSGVFEKKSFVRFFPHDAAPSLPSLAF